jgi:hypothetical protein
VARSTVCVDRLVKEALHPSNVNRDNGSRYVRHGPPHAPATDSEHSDGEDRGGVNRHQRRVTSSMKDRTLDSARRSDSDRMVSS